MGIEEGKERRSEERRRASPSHNVLTGAAHPHLSAEQQIAPVLPLKTIHSLEVNFSFILEAPSASNKESQIKGLFKAPSLMFLSLYNLKHC